MVQIATPHIKYHVVGDKYALGPIIKILPRPPKCGGFIGHAIHIVDGPFPNNESLFAIHTSSRPPSMIAFGQRGHA